MSVSERLKALAAKVENGTIVQRDGDDLLVALPEIVAVVAACERAHPWSTSPPPDEKAALELGRALAALDAALTTKEN